MSTKKKIICPACGYESEQYLNPVPTVDIIIELFSNDDYLGIVLINRRNPPYGWAIPGGFIDYGETVEAAARREAREETSLLVKDLHQFRVYSDPQRDPRQHTISTVFTARAEGEPQAADDAADVCVYGRDELPETMAFDHRTILEDYFQERDRRLSEVMNRALDQPLSDRREIKKANGNRK